MFEFIGDPQLLEVHVFTTNKYKGNITESDGKDLIFLKHSKCGQRSQDQGFLFDMND